MTKNKLKAKILAQEETVGTMLSEIYTPNIVRILKAGGFEYLIVDCEHGYFDFSELANICAIGRGFGIAIIVRVPSIEREFITKILDIGVDGLLLPQIDNVGLARKAIDLTKYTPVGNRGVSTTRAHTDYDPPSLGEYFKQANEDLILLAQIESREGYGNVDEIAKVEGIDGLVVGPNDMAADFGHPGETFSDEMKERVQKVVAACKANGKSCGIVDGSMKRLSYWKGLGINVFCIGSELHLLLSAARGTLRDFKALG